jgi:hypothetical protein
MQNTQHRMPGLLPGIAGLVIITIALLAGCSSGSPASSAATGAKAGANTGAMRAAGPGSAAGHTGTGAATTQNVSLASDGAQLVYTAQFTVQATDVTTAVSRVTSIVAAAGGYISQENVGSTATLQVKIPVAVYPATLSQLTSGTLGSRMSLEQQAQDVTQQVADVTSQVASDDAAIAQLRALLTRAGSVGDLLTVQDQINSEESALESMQAQQKALDNETAFATVTITVLGPVVKAVVVPIPRHPVGLVSGLTAGWHAFRTTLTWLLAILGAIAPFAALIAVAGYLGYRARRWIIR